MSKKDSISFVVEVPIYIFDILFSFGQSDKELKKELNRLDVEFQDSEYQYSHSQNTGKVIATDAVGGPFVVRLREIPRTPGFHGVLAHEIFHVVDFALRDKGMPLVQESCEAYAYLIQYITEMVFLELKNNKV